MAHGLRIEFYLRAVQNNYKSEKEGKPVWEDKIYIKKISPSDLSNIIDRPMREGDKKQFHEEWRRYELGESERVMVVGCPLEELGFTPALIKTLNDREIRTVEQLSLCSDEGLSRIMGGFQMKQTALKYLETKKESKQDGVNESLLAKIEELEKKLEDKNSKRHDPRKKRK